MTTPGAGAGSAPASAPTFASLPVGVVERVLALLDYDEVGRAACVSRQFRQGAAGRGAALYHLCLKGCAAGVERLLAQPSARGFLDLRHYPRDEPPLHAAIAAGHPAVASLLLAAGCGIEACDRWRSTALAAACALGHDRFLEPSSPHLEIVDSLIAAGADVNAACRRERFFQDLTGPPKSILHDACLAGRGAVVRRLVAAGARLPPLDALMRAAYQGHTEVVESLAAGGIVTPATAGASYRAMIVACECEESFVPICAALRAAGAAVDPDDVPGTDPPGAPWIGNDPWFRTWIFKKEPYAARWAVLVPPAGLGDLAEVERLVRLGAPLEGRGGCGYTALMVAARGGHVAVVRRLVELSADLEAADYCVKSTAVVLAAESGHVEVVARLIDAHHAAAEAAAAAAAAAAADPQAAEAAAAAAMEAAFERLSRSYRKAACRADVNDHADVVDLLLMVLGLDELPPDINPFEG